MQFTRDQQAGLLIRSYTPGELCIGEQTFSDAVIIDAQGKVHAWSPAPVETVTLASLGPALDANPELVVLGTGNIQRFPSAHLYADVLRLGIGLEAMTTAAACRTWNLLISDGRRVAAALIP